MRIIKACFVVACLCQCVAAQVRGSTVSGTVLQEGTSAPIAGATVTLGSRTPVVSTTDKNGVFSFAAVAPGRYVVRVTADGYFAPPGGGSDSLEQRFGVTDELTQRQAEAEVTTLVTVNSGLDVKGLVTRLVPGGAIFGRVQNDAKAPLQNRSVIALKKRYVESKIATGIAKTATTDDRGQYRLAGLAPGEYYIEVQGNPSVYFPTVTSIGRAESIQLIAGREFAAGDIVVPTFVGRSISGTLPGAFSLDHGIVFYLIPADATISSASDAGIVPAVNVSTNAGGRTFELRNVFPGTYDLFARVGLGATEQPGYYRTLQAVRVADENITNIVLSFNANVNITGRLMSDTGGPVTPGPGTTPVVPRGGVSNPPSLQVRFRQTDEFFSHLVYLTTTAQKIVTADRNGMFQLTDRKSVV